ncbi:MAG: glycoside hydrolase N-terminal domain-containing protein, partial [Bacteroides sp.]|nr:glycoside hydrolase N-terminal domain-containing protein [Bacteroides sp.]
MKNDISFLLATLLLVTSNLVIGQSDHILWYDRPAQFFEESLVLGNGQTGASVFGGVE